MVPRICSRSRTCPKNQSNAERGGSRGRACAAGRRRSPSTTGATTPRTRRRSPTPSTMRCGGATSRSSSAFPQLVREDSPSTAGRRRAGRGLRQGRATRVPMLSLDNAFADEDVVEFVDRVRRFLRLRRGCADSPSPPSRRSTGCRCRCATRTGVLVTARDARRRRGGRERHRQCRAPIADIPERAAGRCAGRASRCAARST